MANGEFLVQTRKFNPRRNTMKVVTLTAEQKTRVAANLKALNDARAVVAAAQKSHNDYVASIAGDKQPRPGAYRVSDDGNTLVVGF